MREQYNLTGETVLKMAEAYGLQIRDGGYFRWEKPNMPCQACLLTVMGISKFPDLLPQLKKRHTGEIDSLTASNGLKVSNLATALRYTLCLGDREIDYIVMGFDGHPLRNKEAGTWLHQSLIEAYEFGARIRRELLEMGVLR